MSDEVRIYLLRIWPQHGCWRITIRPVGEERTHLFTRAEQVADFISAITAGTCSAASVGGASEPPPNPSPAAPGSPLLRHDTGP
jgi:hypothetical protein